MNYILKQNYGISLPYAMREEVGYLVKDVSDQEHKSALAAVGLRYFLRKLCG